MMGRAEKLILLGGVLSELDSHTPSPTNPEPIARGFSPWHACGSSFNYGTYSSAMRRNGDLHLLGATLRLLPGETDTQNAAGRWETIFDVKRNEESIEFTNSKIRFIKGEDGQADGIVTITIGVEGKSRLEEIFWRAKLERATSTQPACLAMLGVTWRFILVGKQGLEKSNL
jgi:hypothetical protein